MSETDAPKSDEVEIARWEVTTIKVNTPAGLVDAPGLTHELVPGLAVTSHNFGLFDVTHLKTGKLIAKGYARMDSACLVAAEFALCADWTKDSAGIAAELKATHGEPSGVPGARSIEKGIERPMSKGDVVTMLRTAIPPLDEFPWEGSDGPGHRALRVLGVLDQRRRAREAASI